MGWSSWIVLAASTLVIACGTPSTVMPAPSPVPVVDQTYELRTASDVGFISIGGMSPQTFTVAMAGKLTGADLIANGGITGVIAPDSCAQGVTLDVQLLATSADGSPSSQVLAGGQIPSSRLAQRQIADSRPSDFVHVDLAPQVDVTVGTTLALTATFSGFRCGEILGSGNGASPSTYPGGSVFVQGPNSTWLAVPFADYFFRTYVLPRR